MKKKGILIGFGLVCVMACMLGITACKDSHQHEFSEEWKGDATGHWHVATCEHTDKTAGFDSHKDEDNNGKCDICKYDVDVTVSGTYYFYENDATNDQLYIDFKNGKWTDDENLTGNYSVTGNTITLYIDLENEKTEFASGTAFGDDVTLNLMGAEVIYRKGEDLNSKPKEKILEYSLSEDKTYYIVEGIGGLTGDIVVPEEYKRKPVKEISENAFSSQKALTKIVIGDNVTVIGKKAFYNCFNLVEVVLGESVTTIAQSTFEGCAKLQKITVSASVKSVEFDAFKSCDKLTDIYYTGTVSDWAMIDFSYSVGSYSSSIANPLYSSGYNSEGRKLYIDNELLTVADISSATEIKSTAFLGYSFLESVVIGSDVTKIGEYAFYNCNSLKSIQMSDSGLETIGKRAFGLCESLLSVKVPNSVKNIGDSAFDSCGLTTLELGNGVKIIGYGAFMSCENLIHINLGSSINEISEAAFYGCSKLKNLEMPNSLACIGKEAFVGTALTSVVFKDTDNWQVEKVNSYEQVENLTDDTNAANLLTTSILASGYAEYKWVKYTFVFTLSYDEKYYSISNGGTSIASEIVIPSQYNGLPVAKIAERGFKGCENLSSLTIPDSVKWIEDDAFSGCSGLRSVTIPINIKWIGDEAFAYCSSLECVYWNAMACEHVSVYQTSIFYKCDNITSLVIGENVNSIPKDAFKNSRFTNLTILSNALTEIDMDAFIGCNTLNKTYFAGGDLSDWCKIEFTNPESNPLCYGGNLYINNEQIIDLIIPEDITEIKWATFAGASIKTVVIHDGVTVIGGRSFYECKNLTDVIIGKNVNIIGRLAFYNIRSLKQVIFENTEGWVANSYPEDVIISSSDLEDPLNAVRLIRIYSSGWKREEIS